MNTITRNSNSQHNIFVGIDTHKDTHCAVTVTETGKFMSSLEIETNSKGYRNLINWARKQGTISCFGIEGTGCYGKNLASYLTNYDYQVVEINRVNRQHRRRYGKTDETDAHAAAKAVASGEQTNSHKQTYGRVEIIRVLQIARSSAVKARTQTACQIKAILITAPEPIKNEVNGLTTLKLTTKAVKWRPKHYLTNEISATRHTLKILATRWLTLNKEIKQHDQDLATTLKETVPEMMELQGIGNDVAAKLVIAAGSNPQRMKSEASFAALCGVSPVNASSGKQQRHRLNQGGNRKANNALYTIAITRMKHDPETKKYVNKKTAEGKTKKETIRQLKRHISRQIYKQLTKQLT